MEKKGFRYTRIHSIHIKKNEVEEDFINKKLDEKMSDEEVI